MNKFCKVILVTGGTGLVGSHLLFDLCKSGKKVRALKRGSSNIANVKKVFSYYVSDPDKLLQNIEWVEADLLDIYSLECLMEGVEDIYHCAAMVSFEPKYEAEMMRTNIEGTANMVNAALMKGVRKFCHVSSIATIGRSDHVEQFTEELFWKLSPEHSNYAISKYGAEREVWRASEEGLDVVIVNPSLIIGAGNWQQSSSDLFAKSYKGLSFYTEGENGFVDVRDVSSLMIALMESTVKNQRYILNSENSSYKLFFDSVHKAFGKPLPRIKVGKVLSNIAWRAEKLRSLLMGAAPFITKETASSAHRISRFSNKKIKNVFPDYTFISLEQSIKDTCTLFIKDKREA
jgi:dihydroflavonol-4-reductase